MDFQSLAMRKFSNLLEQAVAESGISCEVKFASGEVCRFGTGNPQFFVKFHTDECLFRGLNEISLGKAYIKGEFDIEGDMFSLQEVRKRLQGKTQFSILVKFRRC